MLSLVFALVLRSHLCGFGGLALMGSAFYLDMSVVKSSFTFARHLIPLLWFGLYLHYGFVSN
jgi:hypothetical protein